jgi:hypothetical protein
MLSVVILSVIMLSVIIKTVMLKAFMMLSAIMLSVIVLSVAAPIYPFFFNICPEPNNYYYLYFVLIRNP